MRLGFLLKRVLYCPASGQESLAALGVIATTSRTVIIAFVNHQNIVRNQ